MAWEHPPPTLNATPLPSLQVGGGLVSGSLLSSEPMLGFSLVMSWVRWAEQQSAWCRGASAIRSVSLDGPCPLTALGMALLGLWTPWSRRPQWPAPSSCRSPGVACAAAGRL